MIIDMKNTYLIYFLFFSVFLYSCGTKSNDNLRESNNIEDQKFHNIKSFLGFTMSMSTIEVIKFLDSKSIKHSAILPRFKNIFFEGYRYHHSEMAEKFIEVYNYPIGGEILDKFYLFFIGDELYLFQFGQYNISHNNYQNSDINGYLNSQRFKDKYGKIIGFINEALILKYGSPNLSNTNSDSPSIDKQNLFINGESGNGSKSRKCVSYFGEWKSSKIDKYLNVVINSGQCVDSSQVRFGEFPSKDNILKKYYFVYDTYYQISVDFSNFKIRKFLNNAEKNNSLKDSLDRIKEKLIKKKLVDLI